MKSEARIRVGVKINLFQLWYSDFTGDERWQEIYDQQTGRSYYWNKRTNRTEWELPARPISSEKSSDNPINLTFKRGTIDYNKLEKGKKVTSNYVDSRHSQPIRFQDRKLFQPIF